MSDLPELNSNKWGEDYWNICLKEMADTITKLELWDWFCNETPPEDQGYQWWDHDNINKISDNLPHNDHSGSSFACALRNMEFIAKNGFTEWLKKNDGPS